MNINEVISNVVKGLELRKGTVILLNFWGDNKDLEILERFALEVIRLGAMPIKWQQSRIFNKNMFTEMSLEEFKIPDKYFDVFKIADAVIDIFMYGVAPHNEFPKDKYPLYGEYMKKLFGALVENKEIFVQVRIPTEENAMEEDVDFEVYQKSMVQAMSVDYPELKEESEILVNKLQGKQRVAIETGKDNVLTMDLGDRVWQKDDGTGDIPSGEVYIAPIEESANGRILIPFINLGGEKLKEVLLEFSNGKLVNASEIKLIDFINAFTGDKDIIAELGIGLNGNIKEQIGCALVDEKIKGTAHIAIGMNRLFGGKNGSQLHMDFIFIPKKLVIDDEIIMDGTNIIF